MKDTVFIKISVLFLSSFRRSVLWRVYAQIQKSRVSFRRIKFYCHVLWTGMIFFLCFIRRKFFRLLLHRKFYVKHRKVLRANSGRGIRTADVKYALCSVGCGSWICATIDCVWLWVVQFLWSTTSFRRTSKLNWRINASIST